jgi:hypothetical protein
MSSVFICREDFKQGNGMIQGGNVLHARKAAEFAFDLGDTAFVIFAGVFGSGQTAPDLIEDVFGGTGNNELPAALS